MLKRRLVGKRKQGTVFLGERDKQENFLYTLNNCAVDIVEMIKMSPSRLLFSLIYE